MATGYFARDRREVQKAFERAVFDVVFNNRDDHGKNFSFRLARAAAAADARRRAGGGVGRASH